MNPFLAILEQAAAAFLAQAVPEAGQTVAALIGQLESSLNNVLSNHAHQAVITPKPTVNP